MELDDFEGLKNDNEILRFHLRKTKLTPLINCDVFPNNWQTRLDIVLSKTTANSNTQSKARIEYRKISRHKSQVRFSHFIVIDELNKTHWFCWLSPLLHLCCSAR